MSDTFIGLIAFFIMAPMITSIIVQSYIAHRHIEDYEALLPNCSFIIENRTLFQNGGLPGKLMRTGLIAWVLAIPGIFVKKGFIDLDEVKRFPPRTKRLLVSVLYVQCVTLIALVIFNYACLEP